MRDEENTRDRILNGTLDMICKTGLKFTMDALARNLTMSKKTIYALFSDKDDLLTALVNAIFDEVSEEQQKVLSNHALSIVEKLRGILCVMPTRYTDIDLSEVYSVQEKYPKAYKRMNERIEDNWEPTFTLLEEGMEKGIFRKFDTMIFQLTYEAAVERFLQGDDLARGRIPYMKALGELVSLLVDGIVV